MQWGKQPLWVRLQLLARLTLNAGEDAANQPARLAHLDDGNDRAILVQRHQGPAQIVRLRHRGTPSIDVSDEIAILAARPIASLRWRRMDSNFSYADAVDLEARLRPSAPPMKALSARTRCYAWLLPASPDPARTRGHAAGTPGHIPRGCAGR